MHTSTGTKTQTSSPLTILPTPPETRDLLHSIYRHPGPYVSVYLEVHPQREDASDTLDADWADLRGSLVAQHAPQPAIDAIDARIGLPSPEDTAGMCIIAAADGHAIVDHALEAPRQNVALVDALPYVSPLLEWDQRRIPHVVVTVDQDGADIVGFGTNHDTTVSHVELDGDPNDLAVDIATRIEAFDARLVVLAGDSEICRQLMHALAELVDPQCRILVDDHKTVDGLADATVRYVLDTAARDTVSKLREFRFLASHEAAVDGTAATIDAVTAGTPDILLIHDDPHDDRRIWINPDDPAALSVMQRNDCNVEARFVDAIIRSANAQGMDIHIIPTTGPAGPDGDIAALGGPATLSSSAAIDTAI